VNRALALVAKLDKALSPEEFLEAASLVDTFAALKYSKTKLIDATSVEKFFESKGLLVPVTTEATLPRSLAIPLELSSGKSSAVITRQLPETG
jgi:hypothetical protein